MKHIDEAILNYVEQKNNDYAVLLTGKWGSGKTYYLNNTLKGKIEEKGFKMIVISLYGVSTIKEVSTMIFAERNPKLAKAIKYGGPILKSVLKNIDIADFLKFDIDEIDKNKKTDIKINQEKTIEDTGNFFSKFIKSKQENIKVNEKNIIICFDDLERKNDGLKTTEIIGFINNFVENGTKVIVLANEDVIENFKELKEKTFGLSLSFKQTYENAISGILKTNFEDDERFQTHIKAKIEILNVFRKNENLRILKFGLNCFHTIFSQIEVEKDNFKNLNYNEICDELLKFVLAISVEFREGRIAFDNGNGINNSITKTDQEMYAFTRNLQLKNNDSPQIKSYKDSFLEKYYPNSQYTYFSSVFSYITSGYLDKTELISELEEIDRKALKPAYQLYNSLFSNGRYGLLQYDDSLLKADFEKVINFANEGDFEKLNEYSTIYFYLKFYSEYGFDMIELEESLLKVITDKISATSTESLKNNIGYTKEFDNQNAEGLGEKISNLIYKELDIRKESITKDLDNKSLEFIVSTLEEDVNNPSLNSVNIETLFEKLSNSENSLLQRFYHILQKRWPESNVQSISSDKTFIKALELLISKRIAKPEEINKNITFNWLKSVLQDRLKSIDKT
jgi:ribosomal protein S13